MSKNDTRHDAGAAGRLDPLLLQAYFDGELDAAESARVEALLEASSDDRERLEVLAEMRELTRFDLEQRTEDVDLDGLWGRIEHELDAAEAPARPAATAPAAARTEPVGPSWWESIKAFFAGHKGVLVPTMVAATVVTLVLVPFLLNQPPTERVVEVQKERTIVIVDEPLRFEGNATGAVSYTPDTNTPVIWYLGEPSPNARTDGGGAEVAPAEPATLRRDIRLPIPLDKLLERLERLERAVLPPASGGATTPPTPPPVEDRSDEGSPGRPGPI